MALSEWRHGWPLVAVSVVGAAIAGMHVHSLGVLIGPLEAEYRWARAEITGGLVGYSVVTIIFAPLVGLMIDRYGVRRIGIPGLVIFCGSIALLSTTSHSIWNWWGIWLAIAFGASFIKPMLWSAAISRRFIAQRGLALAVMLSGSGVGVAIVPIVTNWLLVRYGWRAAYVALAGGALIIMLPAMLLYLHDAAPRTPKASSAKHSRSGGGLSLRESLTSTHFFRIGSVALFMSLAMLGLTVNFVPISISLGIDRASAVAIAGIIGIASIFGRLVTGALLDRFSGAVIGAINFSLPIAAVALLLTGEGSQLLMMMAAAVLGFSLGAEVDLLAYVTTRYFGLKNFGAIYGVITGLLAIGQGLGPTVAGAIYDDHGSYSAFLWATIPVFVGAALMIGTLGRYPEFSVNSDVVAARRVGERAA